MGALCMSVEERRRLGVMVRVREAGIGLKDAARMLGVSYRQVKRIWGRYRKEGDAGLVHRLRGRGSSRAHPQREVILVRYHATYEGFGPTLASEHLAREGLPVTPETLRRWLKATGGATYRPRRKGRHRQRRERRACFGELIQIDGSSHDWLEGRGPLLVLMVMIDDATGQTLARFYLAETLAAAMDLFERWVQAHGLPLELYPDRDSIYIINRPPTLEEQLEGQEAPLTQFGRAMQVLGVKLTPANSPQAKGRVERRHGLFQDRLVKELRLHNIRDLDAANDYLARVFLPALNSRWTHAPANPTDVHRALPRGMNLNEVLSVEEPRVVAHDFTVCYQRRILQITIRNPILPRPRSRVVVRRLRNGALQLLHQGRKLHFRELDQKPRPPAPPPALPVRTPKPSRPAATHPWKKYRACAPATPPQGVPPGAFPPFPRLAPRGHF